MNDLSLKAKLTFFVGFLVVLLQGSLSLFVLNHERVFLIQKHQDAALASARAFSIPILDALIGDDLDPGSAEKNLADAIEQFMLRTEEAPSYVAVTSPQGIVLAHSDLPEYGADYQSKLSPFPRSRASSSRIYRQGEQWTIEAFLPLEISTKRWGYLLLGFDGGVIREEIRGLYFYLMSLFLAITLITLIAVYAIVWGSTRRLNQMVRAVDALDLESLEPMPLPSGRDEVGLLAFRFHSLRRRLSRSRRELMRAEREVHHAEKLASIGRLAAGVAHEINNPLMGVQNSIDILREKPGHERREEYLSLAEDALRRIETIVRKLLEYSRKRPRDSRKVNLQECLQKMLELLDFRIEKKGVKVQVVLQCEDLTVQGDDQLLEEVMMNLLVNACDAMEEEGQLTICFQEEGDCLCVDFEDNGHGVPDRLKKQIFDPFFTTKEVGQGTGLGLSVSQSIVENHGGQIILKDADNGGAVFRVILPRSPSDGESQ